MSAELAVQTQDLEMIYREMWRKPARALTGVSLEVERGVIFGLLGQNGAGKTTLVKLLLSLLRPTKGTARVLGHDPFDSRMRRRIGYLPEQMRLPEYMKATGFLHYMGELNGVDSATLKKRIPALLELVGLPGEKKLLSAYSKGMQQRLGLAQALLNEPDLLFLDEPTVGVDPELRRTFWGYFKRLNAEGVTIVITTHYLDEAERADRLGMLREGRLIAEGSPAGLKDGSGRSTLEEAFLHFAEAGA